MSENISTSSLNFHQKHEESRHGYKKLEYDTVFKQDTDSSRVEQDDHQEDEDGFMLIDRETIRIDVQCPICLGIIKKTRTMMECMHRFCKECIDKAMRLGNNECPACRTHCASRRSLRDDPRFDELISALYPDIQKVEEEELAFCEEDEARDKQIRESIAQVHIKQSEALGKKRAANKDSAGTSVVVSKRRKKNKSTIEHIEEERDSCPASTCEPLRLSWGQFGVRSYNRHRANFGLATMVDSHRNTEKIDDVPKALVIPSEDVKVDAIANDSRDHQSVPQSYSDNKPSIANGTTSGEHPMLQYKKKSSFRIVLSRKR